MLKNLLRNARNASKYYIVIGVLGVLVIGGFVYANVIETGQTVINAENVTVENQCSSDTFGAASDYCHETNATTTACNYEFYAIDVDTDTTLNGTFSVPGTSYFSGTTVFSDNATTTPPKHAYSSIDFALTQVATTTVANPAEAGYWCNTGDVLMITDWWWELETTNGVWGSNWSIGTTTCSIAGSTCGDGSDGSFVATTTETIVTSGHFATSTTGMFTLDGYSRWDYTGFSHPSAIATSSIGSYYQNKTGDRIFSTSSPLILISGECIVVYSDHSGATSSASYYGDSETGAVETVGRFHADTVIR
jgi:hypothetical protein